MKRICPFPHLYCDCRGPARRPFSPGACRGLHLASLLCSFLLSLFPTWQPEGCSNNINHHVTLCSELLVTSHLFQVKPRCWNHVRSPSRWLHAPLRAPGCPDPFPGRGSRAPEMLPGCSFHLGHSHGRFLFSFYLVQSGLCSDIAASIPTILGPDLSSWLYSSPFALTTRRALCFVNLFTFVSPPH